MKEFCVHKALSYNKPYNNRPSKSSFRVNCVYSLMKDGDARLLNLNVKMVSECMLLVDLQERLGSMKQGKIQVR